VREVAGRVELAKDGRQLGRIVLWRGKAVVDVDDAVEAQRLDGIITKSDLIRTGEDEEYSEARSESVDLVYDLDHPHWSAALLQVLSESGYECSLVEDDDQT
jgi:hypothetical protein